jgi:hypothetical protein
MGPDQTERLRAIHFELIKITQAWALRRQPDLARAAQLRRRAALLLHAHYLETVPAYGRLARQEGIDRLDQGEIEPAIETIKRHLMLPDDLFKSYDQKWLDEKAFGRMNTWLAEIFHQPVDLDVADVRSIDQWIDRLGEAGIRLVYSSGTSGNFSFVPRDLASWRRFRLANASTLTPLIAAKVGGAWQRVLLGPACRLLPPDVFSRLTQGIGVKDYDAFFLDFQHGHTGNQTLGQELAPLFRRSFALYETELSPTVLRLLSRGPRTDEDREQLAQLQNVVADRRDDNYRRLAGRIQESTAAGQKIFIFGTTHQYKEFCDFLTARAEQLDPRPGSLLLFGGGWKSFSGVRIARDQLLDLMSDRLGLPPDHLLEGYSMTEINTFMLRCDHGRFHVPPLIEPILFDEELSPMAGPFLEPEAPAAPVAAATGARRGILGFLDPFAMAYPGFLVSGDEVQMVDGDCACGLSGPAVTDISRASVREMKGCGGIMASLAT